MPALQQRVAARGFPVIDVAGQSGQGALPDSTRPGAGSTPGQPTATWADPNIDVGSVPATMPAPEPYVLGQTLWGLSGAARPSNTPRTHAAPVADPTLAWQDGGKKNSEGIYEYNAELEAVHDPGFNGWEIRNRPDTNSKFGFGQQLATGIGTTDLQPTYKQPISNLAGKDAVQGWGSLGGGPGGTNKYMQHTELDRQFPGQTYHGVFLNVAEVPFLVANADQFIASAPELPAYMPTFDGPTASVLAQQVVVSDSPAQGPDVSAGPALLPLWGS